MLDPLFVTPVHYGKEHPLALEAQTFPLPTYLPPNLSFPQKDRPLRLCSLLEGKVCKGPRAGPSDPSSGPALVFFCPPALIADNF